MTGSLTRFAGMHVLVVDDNPANVSLLVMLLGDEGLRGVAAVTDATRVVDQLAANPPDLVMLDLHMPRLDGFAVLQQIQAFAAGSYLPVLVLTADTSTVARDRALSHGARDFVTKPFDNREVTLRVANLLETRQLYLAVEPERDADRALGRNRHDVEVAVEHALADGGIEPVFQAIVDARGLQVVGYEALSRFSTGHPRGPAGWFADAFAVGRGTDLERRAISLAVAAYDPTEPGETFLAVNLSPATLLTVTESALCDPGLWPRIVVELTEHVPVQDYAALKAALRQMRAAGTRLAADDLGAGYAGFRHLVALEPDIIKLDISLVRDIDRSRAQRALASAIVAFAADMGSRVIAEGIERPGELDVVQQLGVDWAQGYHFGHPCPWDRRGTPVSS